MTAENRMTEVPHLTGESKVGEAEKNLLSHLRTKMDHRGTRTRYRVKARPLSLPQLMCFRR